MNTQERLPKLQIYAACKTYYKTYINVEHRTTESNAPKVLFHLGNQIFPHPRTK